MKKPNALILFLIISVFGQSIFAQKIFREGYIVKKNGESFTGLVEYSAKQKIPAICTFKRFDIARTVDYSPWYIQAFGYRNGNRYESRVLDKVTSFFEVLVSGKIVLYQKGSKYYIDKDHLGLVELKNGPVSYSAPDGTKDFKTLAEFLAFVTEGKAGPVTAKFSLKNDIIHLIASYNKESGKSYNVFKRSFTEKQLTQDAWKSGAAKNRFGVITGANLYTLNLKFNPDMYGITSADYVPNPDKEMGLAAGLTYERLISRKTDRMSLVINLIYNNQSFYSYSERTGNAGSKIRDDAWFSFTGIKMPVLFQYSFTGGRVVPYFNAGAAYQFFLNTDYRHVAETESTISHEITTSEDQNMTFNKGELTGAGGLGVRTRIFTKLNLHLQCMVEAGKGLFVNELLNDVNARKNKPYVQNSFQTTVLLGITF
jgi:hypothetical protein